jgi:hypothetical protein
MPCLSPWQQLLGSQKWGWDSPAPLQMLPGREEASWADCPPTRFTKANNTGDSLKGSLWGGGDRREVPTNTHPHWEPLSAPPSCNMPAFPWAKCGKGLPPALVPALPWSSLGPFVPVSQTVTSHHASPLSAATPSRVSCAPTQL